MSGFIPCHRGPNCKWPACHISCDGRPGIPAVTSGHVGHTIHVDDELRADMDKQHILDSRFGYQVIVADYAFGFNFAEEICRLLVAKGIVDKCGDLSHLHLQLTQEQMALGEDELNSVSRAFYETDDAFIAIYHDFLLDVEDQLDSSIYYQTTPTIRFHFPYEPGFNWQPRFHTDVMLGHPPLGVNIWMPITPAFGSNTMRLISYEDSMDALGKGYNFNFEQFALDIQDNPMIQHVCHLLSKPAEMDPSEYLLFNPMCLHATQPNTTDCTRVSMDCRVIPVGEYDRLKKRYKGTGRQQLEFVPGSYYDSNPL